MTDDHIAIYVQDGDGPVVGFRAGSPEHHAHLEWARFHGLDPNVIPFGSLVVRDAAACAIRYERFVFDPPEARLAQPPDYMALVVVDHDAVTEDVIEQGEAPPLPFPMVLP